MVVAVIPCFNEAKFIDNVVRKARLYVDRVVVTDDNSVDDTVAIARDAGAQVYLNDNQRGFGSNLLNGIRKTLDSGREQVIVTLDGDGQHDPRDIPQLVALIKSNKASVVIGSRLLGDHQSMPLYRKMGVGVINCLFNVGSKVRVTDSQSCLRAYSREVLENIYLADKAFGVSTEILIKARRFGYSIKEVPIACIYHADLWSNSTLNPIRHGLQVAMATVMWRLRC